ncbi:MAG TPA: hypothetical protein VGP82_02065 [Ktedonobacterales bacterium]|nr:hypothetical protein [Ktedonobacterales bacterium]
MIRRIRVGGVIRLVFWQGCAALGDMQVVDARSPHEVCATDLPGWVNQHLVLARAKQQVADDAALQGVERDPIQAHQPIGARIVRHPAARAELGQVSRRLALTALTASMASTAFARALTASCAPNR